MLMFLIGKLKQQMDIVVIDNCEYLQSKNHPEFRLCANAAFNYPWNEEEREEDCDYEHMSSTNEDYSSSNPWDAPSMSVKDFI